MLHPVPCGISPAWRGPAPGVSCCWARCAAWPVVCGSSRCGFHRAYLLLRILLQGMTPGGLRRVSGSAARPSWSLSQTSAYAVFFPALGAVAAYHLLSSENPRGQLCCGLVLGLALAGFFMLLYPRGSEPGLCAPAVVRRSSHPGSTLQSFVAAAHPRGARCRRHPRRRTDRRFRVVLSGCLAADGPDAVSRTTCVRRGRLRVRRAVSWILQLFTVFDGPGVLRNESEATFCYLFFPAILAAAPFCPRCDGNWARRAGCSAPISA